MYKILIADDEKEIVQLLRLYLERDDIHVTEASNGLAAVELLRVHEFDLAIIDIMMPMLNGFELIKHIRKTSIMPIIVISAKVQSSDKIFGLELGADDYITKPFDAMEVTARVKATLRRFYNLGSANKSMLEQITVGNLTLDLGECVVYRDGNRIDLSSVEYKVLSMFMGNPGRVFTREQIFEAGWMNDIVDDNTIRVAISKLRNKIGDDKITTIRGLGYRMEKSI